MIDISSRYLIILIFRSFFLFSFFFYALASLLLFATREIISRFEREEYFSVKVVLVIVAILSLEYYSLLKLRLLGEGLDRISVEILFARYRLYLFVFITLDGRKTLNKFSNVTLILFQFSYEYSNKYIFQKNISLHILCVSR